MLASSLSERGGTLGLGRGCAAGAVGAGTATGGAVAVERETAGSKEATTILFAAGGAAEPGFGVDGAAGFAAGGARVKVFAGEGCGADGFAVTAVGS